MTNDPATTYQSINLYKVYSRTLQKLEIPILDDDVCKENVNYKNYDASLLFCLGEKGEYQTDI